jgi:hypothetical protein
VLTCREAERRALLGFDRADLDAWIELHARLVAGGDDEVATIELATARLWLAFASVGVPPTPAQAHELHHRAAAARAAPLVIETTVLRALCTAAAGDLDEGAQIARRACRMAQAEGLPQEEYLANLVLARMRRYTGRPHLALHIAGALTRVAPPQWQPWLAWEVLLAGGDSGGSGGLDDAAVVATGLADSPAVSATRALAAAVHAARAGDRRTFEDQIATVMSALPGFPSLRYEAEALAQAIDSQRDVGASGDIGAWRRGQVTQMPAGLHGIGAPQDLGAGESAVAFVMASPGLPGCRVLRPGLGLAPRARTLDRDRADDGESQTGGGDTGGSRIFSAIATLALAGPGGLPRADFFHSVYGFRFVAERHQGVLDVLVHRLRDALGNSADIERGERPGDGADAGPFVALSLHEPIVVADGRCALPVADRVLRALATLGTASAAEAAHSLRMPLRAVQNALSQLVSEGACNLERHGRKIFYRVHDTTFTQVTGGSKPTTA